MDQSEELQQMKELIYYIEESDKTEEVIEWMEEICSVDDQSQLIESLIQTFQDNINDDFQYANSILKVLRKLNEWIPEKVLPQMKNSNQFPIAISKYLTNLELKNMVGDGFILLTKIFQKSNFKNVTNEKFIKVLFDSFEFIEDEEIFKAVVEILVEISKESVETQQNLVLQICLVHPNSRFFSETLIQLLNKGILEENLESGLNFVAQILKEQPQFFYENDFRILSEVAVRNIQDYPGKPRFYYLKTVYEMSLVKNFTKIIGKSRIQEIQELMNVIIEDCDEKLCITEAKKIIQQIEKQ